MLSGANRDLAFDEVLDALMHAMKGVLQRNEWSSVFADSGFGPDFKIRSHLLEVLEWRQPPVIPADLPTLAQFKSCFPTGRHIPFMHLLSGLLPRTEQPPRRERAAARLASGDEGEEQPWSKRLRPRSGGRAIIAKAKSEVAPLDSSPPPVEATKAPPRRRMMNACSHVLHSLKPLPVPKGRSRSGLIDRS